MRSASRTSAQATVQYCSSAWHAGQTVRNRTIQIHLEMLGKAQRVARPAPLLRTSHCGIETFTAVSGDMVTECLFLPLIYFRGYSTEIDIAGFLLSK